jgi:hypothetical protein
MSPTPTLASVKRLDTVTARTAMERVAELGLIERGAVAVISVDAIRERTGERWMRKRDDVWAYVARKCAEHLTVQDIHHRISDTDFLIAITADHAAAAQAAALRILEDVLVFFLGSAETPDLKIQTVTNFSPTGEIACAALDPRKIARAPVYVDAPNTPYRTSVDPLEERRRNPVSFVTGSGKALKIAFAVEPVVSLRHQVTAALRVDATVTLSSNGMVVPGRAFSRLADDDLAFIDQATMDFGALFLRKARAATQPALILPVSFRTMAGRKGRHALAMAAGGASELLKSSVMAEFTDIDRGTPASRLTEVAGLVSSLCRGVLVRLRPAKDWLAAVRGFKPHGLTVDVADLGESDAQIAANILAFGEQARGAAPALMAFGLPNEGFAQVAGVAGLTHVAIRGPEPVLAASAA